MLFLAVGLHDPRMRPLDPLRPAVHALRRELGIVRATAHWQLHSDWSGGCHHGGRLPRMLWGDTRESTASDSCKYGHQNANNPQNTSEVTHYR